jgi:hypothetical protein
MNCEDIIRMAREARLAEPYHPMNPWSASQEALERFAALVAAAEREACAQVCDKIERRKWETVMNGGAMQGIGARDCAAAIRARGEQ